jgi:hypothetical protein
MPRHLSGSALHAVVILAALAAPLAARAQTWRIDLAQAGQLKIGTALDRLPVRLKQPLVRTEQDPTGHCFYAEPASTPALHLMIVGGRLVRFDVYEPGIATVDGVQVGDSVEKLKKVYGDRLSSAPNFYAEDELDYRVQSADGRHALRFETTAGKITDFFAGDAKAVAYVEGCL